MTVWRRLVVGATFAALAFGGAAPSIAAERRAPGAAEGAGLAATVRTLLGTVPDVVRLATDLGSLDSHRRLTVVLPLALPHQHQLDKYVEDLYRPRSAHFHDFLSPTEFGATFGAPPEAVAIVTRTLQDLGLQVEPAAPNRLFVEASAPVSVLEGVFGTALHKFSLGGREFFANVDDLKLPASLLGAVTGVIGLDDVGRPVPKVRAAEPTSASPAAIGPIGQNGGATPCPAAVAGIGYTAPQLATAYNFNGLYAKGFLGQGMSAALVEFDDYHDSNVKAVKDCYKLNTPVTRRLVAGGSGGPPASGEIEDMADITTMLEMLPKLAHLYVYVAPITSVGELQLYSAVVNDNLAPVISSSWGNCEDLNSAADNRLYATITQQAAAQGQQIFDASGDSGATDCSSVFPSPTGDSISVEQEAAVPWVTGVGGTNLGARTANGLPGPRRETTWNSNGAGGGGVSALWRMPSWQYALSSVRHAPGASRKPCGAPKGQLCRAVPDLSANADPAFGMQGNNLQYTDDIGSPGYSFYCGTPNCNLFGLPLPDLGGVGGWQPVGGTSLATPLTAAAAVLWNQAAKAAGLNALGLINPSLYRIAADPAKYARDFHDITTDSNDARYDTADCPPGCNPHHLYKAAKGYDMATGLGSYDATNLGMDLVASAERITLTPDRVKVYGYRHGVATTAPVAVSTGYRSASYTARSDQPWLRASKGEAPGGLQWSVSPGNLASGTHRGTITIASHGRSAKLHVIYSVSPRAKLKLSTTHLRFHEGALTSTGRPTIATCAGPLWDDEFFDTVNGSTGHQATPRSKQTLRIRNAGAPGSKLHWQALPDSQIGSWLSVDLQRGKRKARPGPALVPTDGTTPGGHSDLLRLVSLGNSNTVGGYPTMQQGTYHGAVRIYDLADPRVVRTVHARLTLGNGRHTPSIRSFEKVSLLEVKQGGSTTARIQLSDGSRGCGFSFSAGSDRRWATPTQASYAGRVAPEGTTTIVIPVSAKHLKPGVYTFTITVQSQDAEPSPTKIPFNLTVRKK